MSPCAVCGQPGQERWSSGYQDLPPVRLPTACSTECAVEAWAATWAVTPDDKRYAAWCCRRRRAEARGEPFTEKSPPDAAQREWLVLLMNNPNLKSRWEAAWMLH